MPREGGSETTLTFDQLSDYFIMQMYERIREEVLADATSGAQLLGHPAAERADELRREIERRGLFCAPINWPAPITVEG